MNLTCNSTLEDLRILPTSEIPIVGQLTFHMLALIIAGACTIIAIAMSLFLIWQHALNYTKPREQKHIIRILFMVPIYATCSWLSLRFYWHAIYFQVISDCYEAFAISSFFALMCHYMAPDLHEQKAFFRQMRPVKPWVWPLNWFAKCCGNQRGPWRTPKSGLTWFNIVWVGIYHYCFIRVAMTITAVVTQYFDRYCESSNNPVFGHIWVIAINCIAVTIAMYCVIQFYVQLREPLAEHSPFLKVLAIKLVIFLSFWQTVAISVGTSTLEIVHANEVLAYPDLKVGIPSLLLCFEMACFAILHLWAFPYRPYTEGAPKTFYPSPDADSGAPSKVNEHYMKAGGFLGLRALFDAINIWDIIKAFGRGIRWLFVGVKHRHNDVSYQTAGKGLDMDDLSPRKGGHGGRLGADTSYGGNPAARSTDHLPIATEFRRSKFDVMHAQQAAMTIPEEKSGRPSDEAAGLIQHAQPMSSLRKGDVSPVHPTHQQYRDDIPAPYREPDEFQYGGGSQQYHEPEYGHQQQQQRPNPRDSTQLKVGNALWGNRNDNGGGPPR